MEALTERQPGERQPPTAEEKGSGEQTEEEQERVAVAAATRARCANTSAHRGDDHLQRCNEPAGKEALMASTHVIAEPRVPQVVITREFDASRELLFRAHTDPDLLVQWFAPPRLTMTVDRFELRDGGTWRYQHWAADGTDYSFRGIFHGEPFHHDTLAEQQVVLKDLFNDGYVSATLDPFSTFTAVQNVQTPYQLNRIRVSGGESIDAYIGILNTTLHVS